MQHVLVVYHGISQLSVMYFAVYTLTFYNYSVIPCHHIKYSRQHNKCDIRLDIILNGFELASIV